MVIHEKTVLITVERHSCIVPQWVPFTYIKEGKKLYGNVASLL